MIEPDQCKSMGEVRAGVDAIDDEIVECLAVRFRFMDAAARIKQSRGEIRDEARKAEVLEHVRSRAAEARAPADSVAMVYENLIEASIAYELSQFDSA